MVASKARIAANQRYRDENYDQLSVAVPKGKRDKYNQAAKIRGMSLAGLVQSSVEEYIENHPVDEVKQ